MFSDHLAKASSYQPMIGGIAKRKARRAPYIRLKRISVTKLFGRFDYDIPLNMDERITILTAPNGYGKSTILRLVNGVIDGDYSALAITTFHEFKLEFEDGLEIFVSRKDKSGSGIIESVTMTDKNGKSKVVKYDPNKGSYPIRQLARSIAAHEPNIVPIGMDRFMDHSLGRPIDILELVSRYGQTMRFDSRFEPLSEVNISNKLPTMYIPADRLYSRLLPRDKNRAGGYESSVTEISQRISEQARLAMNEYAQQSSRIDQNFTVRILDSVNKDSSSERNPTSNNLKRLQEQERIVKNLEARLQKLGLIDASDIPPASAATVKTMAAQKVLKLHFEDMADKYSSLLHFAARVELLLEFLSSLYNYKSVYFSLGRGLYVTTDDGVDLQLESLASGEQHLMVLYGRLLFGSDVPLVLLDEPEISLHLEWQMQFLSHMERISRLHPFDLIIATHSPTLIDGRDDLMVELSDMVP
jgi:predicted ATP-binding protein involved in virulence